MYDPVTNPAVLQRAFQEAAGRYRTLDPDLINCAIDIPGNREPEIAGLLHDGPDAQPNYFINIYEALAHSPNIVIVGDMPGTNRLVSLGLDTVDKEGKALGEVKKANFNRRTRFSFQETEDTQDLTQRDRDLIEVGPADHTLKDAGKSFRREWEVIAHGLECRGEHFPDEHPNFPPQIACLDPQSYRVSGVCVVPRGMYSLLHLLPEHGAVVAYDICNDFGVGATPHADHPLGTFAEIEEEAKHIYSARLSPDDTKGLNDLLDVSLEDIWNQIHQAVPRGHIQRSRDSKMGRTQEMVNRFYKREHGFKTLQEGFFFALEQGVRPEDFKKPEKQRNLVALSSNLPSALELTPSHFPPNFDRYTAMARGESPAAASNVITMPARKIA